MMQAIKINAPETLWTPEKVADALAEAYRVLSATEGRVGHKRIRAAWPEYRVEFSDEVGQQKHKTFKRATLPRLRPSSIQIANMERVLLGGYENGRYMRGWLNGAVKGYEKERRALVAYVMGRAHRYSERQICEAFGYNRVTFRRYRMKAAQIISDQLNRAGLLSW